MKWLRLFLSLTVTIFTFAGCVTFNGDIPISTEIKETYISPAVADGIKDSLVISLDIPELKGLKIRRYRFSVSNESGEVYYIAEEGAAHATGLARLFSGKGISIPDELVWTGVNNESAFVPDGKYFWKVEAWDFKDNSGSTESVAVYVDNTPPSGIVSSPYRLFSPNGDRRQDSLPVYQSDVSPENKWTGEFLNGNGRVVRRLGWEGVAPDFSWDGSGDNGDTLPDGPYTYRLKSTDLAGNSFQALLTGLEINTNLSSIGLAVSAEAFSPNNDGRNDRVIFIPQYDDLENILESRLMVIDSRGNLITSVEKIGEVLDPFAFDGRDEAGAILADGTYYGHFNVTYGDGDSPFIVSEPVALDNTSPHIVISSDSKVFSPDGDGRKDILTIFQSSSEETLWEGVILSLRSGVKMRKTWSGRALPFEWDGNDSSGNPVEDGEYLYRIASTDSAGNSTTLELTGIRIDTATTLVRMKSRDQAFSPNGDGLSDTAVFYIVPDITEGIASWKMDILDESGLCVRAYEQIFGSPPSEFHWPGDRDDGFVLEGLYSARLEVEYEKGNLVTALSDNWIFLDVSPPEIDLTMMPSLFSPDKDGVDDILELNLSIMDRSSVSSWSVEIFDISGSLFREFKGTGDVSRAIVWDGLSVNGELVQSAEEYPLVITATDSLGNMAVKEFIVPVDILVMREGDKLRIIISSIYFKPFTADFQDIEPEKVQRNLETLDRLAVILKKFGDYKIKMEGHAVRIYWNRLDRWEREENEVLLPLSLRRAEVIGEALIDRGISGKRMTTEGFGGYYPVVPHSDLDNRWKNRRVEFILMKD